MNKNDGSLGSNNVVSYGLGRCAEDPFHVVLDEMYLTMRCDMDEAIAEDFNDDIVNNTAKRSCNRMFHGFFLMKSIAIQESESE